MRVLLFSLAFLLLAGAASAQDIGPVRPTAGASPTQIQADPTSLTDGTWTQCLILDGADFLDPVQRFDCQPLDADGITDHVILVTPTGGDVVVRAVTVSATGVPSDPSANRKTVSSVPFSPSLVSDSAQVAGTEDIG